MDLPKTVSVSANDPWRDGPPIIMLSKPLFSNYAPQLLEFDSSNFQLPEPPTGCVSSLERLSLDSKTYPIDRLATILGSTTSLRELELEYESSSSQRIMQPLEEVINLSSLVNVNLTMELLSFVNLWSKVQRPRLAYNRVPCSLYVDRDRPAIFPLEHWKSIVSRMIQGQGSKYDFSQESLAFVYQLSAQASICTSFDLKIVLASLDGLGFTADEYHAFFGGVNTPALIHNLTDVRVAFNAVNLEKVVDYTAALLPILSSMRSITNFGASASFFTCLSILRARGRDRHLSYLESLFPSMRCIYSWTYYATCTGLNSVT
ncbi:hypothetical protein CPC08DRAFT_702893 [Agrocybe pediades]|nr:hypothetical protein CPC08DRAFT_702893 [Agrocybe pediades]